MSNTVLKKQFAEKDVQRLRNLIKGKSGERTSIGVGYSKSDSESHEEGDIWKENGREWTIKNGIRENITKLDKFKNLSIPLFCPSCKHVMDKQLDSHYFKSYGSCLNCRTEFETKLKLEGKWEEYTTMLYNNEIDIQIEEYKSFMEDTLNEGTNGYITEAGDIQKWVGGIDKKRAQSAMEDGINYLKSLKK
jgi:hypothetical protein